ncbi:MAG: glycoside hydrolase family 2 TIM barrel-domain containing protein [Chthoniobacteraceae bacterium]
MQNLHDHWKLSYIDPAPATQSAPTDWRPAQVPGTVQTSPFGLSRGELYQGTRIKEVQWMQEKIWVYRRSLNVPLVADDESVRIVFEGLDYYYEIRIDGIPKLSGEGMFHPVVLLLDEMGGRDVEIEVQLSPPPHTKEEMLEATKAQFGRGWDFAPELRTIGIWDEVRLEIVPRLRVEEAFVETRLENLERARVTVRASLSEYVAQGWAEITLGGSSRRVPLFDTDQITAFVEVEHPRLWWPNGLGAPDLNDLVINLEVSGRKTARYRSRVGLREVARIPAAGQRPTDIPLQFVINGLPFFINGMNWVPPDSSVGNIMDTQYDVPLETFRAGNVNLVRVWGGGLCEKRHFYDRCDELGLLVFQEFPIACGMGTSESYHRQLQRESIEIVRKLRAHPSVFLFSGGNENYHYWHMLKGDDPRLRDALEKALIAVNGGKPLDNPEWLAGAVKRYNEPVHLILGGITADLAPHCLYQNTSAMEGEGEVHGIWTWNPQIGDHRYRMFDTLYDYWRAADQHLYSEASVSSIANPETIRNVTGASESTAIASLEDETWKLHHAFHAAWEQNRDLWLDIPATEKIFGPIRDLRELVVLNQYLQAEGGRFMIEELRRKQPHTTGVIWWGANEPWPSLAGNTLIDYFGRPKLSWPVITNAFSPVILSLRYDDLQPAILQAELWLSCNAPANFKGRYEVEVSVDEDRVIEKHEGTCNANYCESELLRILAPIPIGKEVSAKVRTMLFNNDNKVAHENVYLFGDIRTAVLKTFASKPGA